MRYTTTINERGEMRRKPLRNCDRCANLADAKGKFVKECGKKHSGTFWRELAQWAFKEVE